jgi:uncharacterized membrane protein
MHIERSKLEARMDVLLSWLLRLGVIVCAVIILGGWAVALARNASRPSSLPYLTHGQMLPETEVMHSLAGVSAGLAGGSARAWIALGLMLLIALPIVRVGLTVILFGIERDWVYVGLALTVLVLLLGGLLLGKAL